MNIIPIHIPPLRERKEDIPLLFNHFINVFNKNRDEKIKNISHEARICLNNYSWPGNIRELENLMERISVLKDGTEITMEDLPDSLQNVEHKSSVLTMSFDSNIDFNQSVDEYENELILKALEKTNWNRKKASVLLNLNRTTLIEKIKKKGLKPPETNS